jgi:7SK snRNA methylphosphate capping enzyme
MSRHAARLAVDAACLESSDGAAAAAPADAGGDAAPSDRPSEAAGGAADAAPADGGDDAAPSDRPSEAAGGARSRKSRPCFRYGNYRGYYGYRVGAAMEDHRLLTLQRAWFAGRRCLDVGCNEGLVSLTLAVKFGTASFEGVDIDGALVHNAQAKLRRLQRAAADAAADVAAAPPGEPIPEERASRAAAAVALARMRYRCGLCGSSADVLNGADAAVFCHVRRRGNFLDIDFPPASVDTIVCLSVSKWCALRAAALPRSAADPTPRRVHLNWGDEGLLRLFTRCHEVLAPGGLLILEPQPWKSYRQALRKQTVRARNRRLQRTSRR